MMGVLSWAGGNLWDQACRSVGADLKLSTSLLSCRNPETFHAAEVLEGECPLLGLWVQCSSFLQ